MEDSLKAVKGFLDDNLDTSLGVIESEREEVVKRTGNLSIGESVTLKFPRVSVLPDTTDHDYGYDEKPLIRPWLIHNILIWIEHSAGKKEEVLYTLLRYVEAVNRLQEADDTFGETFVWVKLGAEDYTPLIEDRKEKKMIQGVSVQLECRSLS